MAFDLNSQHHKILVSQSNRTRNVRNNQRRENITETSKQYLKIIIFQNKAPKQNDLSIIIEGFLKAEIF